MPLRAAAVAGPRGDVARSNVYLIGAVLTALAFGLYVPAGTRLGGSTLARPGPPAAVIPLIVPSAPLLWGVDALWKRFRSAQGRWNPERQPLDHVVQGIDTCVRDV